MNRCLGTYFDDEERRRRIGERLDRENAAWRAGYSDRTNGLPRQDTGEDTQSHYDRGYQVAAERLREEPDAQGKDQDSR